MMRNSIHTYDLKVDLKNFKPQLPVVLLALCIFLGACSSAVKYNGQNKVRNSQVVNLVPWESDESAKRLARSAHKADFFSLTNHFNSQDNGIFCALASSSIVLNALQLGKSKSIPFDKTSISSSEGKHISKTYNPYFRKYTQYNVLSKSKKKREEVLGKPILINGKKKKDFGLQLHQLEEALHSNGAKVIKVSVSDSYDAELVKNDLIDNLKTPGDYVLVNYSRKALGQKGGGHVSPLGMYDQQSDSFLIMDVNPNRASWVWVSSSDLINAMRTFDTVENRGYILVSNPLNH